MIAPDEVPVDAHEHHPARDAWSGRTCWQLCLCGAGRVVEFPPVDPVLGAGEPLSVGGWSGPPQEPVPCPGAVVRGLLHATVERIADTDPVPGLQRLQAEVERLITTHVDRSLTDPIVDTYLDVVADLERQDAAEFGGAR